MKVLIVGDGTGALAAARELAQAGWFVGVASEQRWGWASASRRTSRWHHIPSPTGNTDAFVDAVNRATDEQGYDVLFPATDTELLALSAVRGKLTARFPYAAHPSVLRGVDKLELATLARDCGFLAPLTREPDEDALTELGVPIVVKPRLHWQPDGRTSPTRLEAAVANSAASARQQVTAMQNAGLAPVFQQFVPGELLAYVVFADRDHKIAAEHVRLAVHERSSDTGPVALAESRPVPPALSANAQVFLEKLQWIGLATLQFQVTESGDYYLIDFNGRMDGEYALTNACGLRAMDAWARLAMDPAATSAGNNDIGTVAVGPRYQAIEGDLLHALAQQGAARIGAILSTMFGWFSAVHPIFTWSDPMPVAPYVARRVKRLLARLSGGG